MSKTLRAFALSATLATIAVAAQASPTAIVLDFESLAKSATEAGASGVAVGGAFAGSGLQFSGALAFHNDFTSHDTNWGSVFVEDAIDNIRIDAVKGFDLTFAKLTFNYGVGQFPFNVTVTDVNGKSASKLIFGRDSGFGWNPAAAELDLAGLSSVSSIVFASENNQGLFSLDNFSLLPSTQPGGGNVPEPASFGLVALALLGAAASRRRTRT